MNTIRYITRNMATVLFSSFFTVSIVTNSPITFGDAGNVKFEENYWPSYCGIDEDEFNWFREEDYDYSAEVEEIYSEFILQLRIAHMRVLHWINNYTRFKFRMSYEEKLIEDQGHHYTWLQVESVIPRTIPSSSRHYTNETLDEFLCKVKEILQRFAVAWNHMVQEDDPHFSHQFQEVQNSNRLVLCKLRMLLLVNLNSTNFSQTEDVPVMPAVLRLFRYDSDRSTRNFRILKDYIQVLEYLIE